MQIIREDPSNMPDSVRNNYQNFMKALLFLCEKSIDIREKAEQKQEKEEQAEEDPNCIENGEIYEDEEIGEFDSEDYDDDEWRLDDDESAERDLYDTRLDNVDEIIVLRDQFNQMQKDSQQLYEHMVNSMTP